MHQLRNFTAHTGPWREGTGQEVSGAWGFYAGYNPAGSMPDPDPARRHLEVLRNAARGAQERFLVALPDPMERQRIVSALATEGFVLEVDTIAEALARLA